MSWYVQKLLFNSENIRSNLYNKEENTLSIDLESDTYSDLLSVEMTIDILSKSNILTYKETPILFLIKEGTSISKMEKIMKLSRPTIYAIIRSACNKIAFYLGDYFTNDGFIEYLSNKYKDIDIEKVKKYMEKNTL